MRRNIIIYLVLIGFIICPNIVISAQYEDFRWGISKEEAIQKIKAKGHTINRDEKSFLLTGPFIQYEDTIEISQFELGVALFHFSKF